MIGSLSLRLELDLGSSSNFSHLMLISIVSAAKFGENVY
jgi:hypothetical protein